jgi:hypothetical protein
MAAICDFPPEAAFQEATPFKSLTEGHFEGHIPTDAVQMRSSSE